MTGSTVDLILALQVVSLFFGIWFGSVNVTLLGWKQDIRPANFVIMSAAWTSFITATWLI
jgi:hypothetical protein